MISALWVTFRSTLVLVARQEFSTDNTQKKYEETKTLNLPRKIAAAIRTMDIKFRRSFQEELRGGMLRALSGEAFMKVSLLTDMIH